MDRKVLNHAPSPAKAFLRAQLDRPAAGPVYSDEYLERWASVYLANQALRLLGVPFERFLIAPGAWLRWAASPLRSGVPAIPRDVAAAIEAAERAAGHGSNGRLVEKMRHKARPRSFRAFIPLRNA